MMIVKWLSIRTRTTLADVQTYYDSLIDAGMRVGRCLSRTDIYGPITARRNFSERAACRFPKNRTCLPECVCGFSLERSNGRAREGEGSSLKSARTGNMYTGFGFFPALPFSTPRPAGKGPAGKVVDDQYLRSTFIFVMRCSRHSYVYTLLVSFSHYRFTHYLTSF